METYINKEQVSAIDTSCVYSVSNKDELNKLLSDFGDGRSSKYLSKKSWNEKNEDVNLRELKHSIGSVLNHLELIEKKLDNLIRQMI